MKRILIAMAAMMMMSGVARADGVNAYAGIAVGAFGVEVKNPAIGYNQKNTVLGWYGKFGLEFNDYVAAELRIGSTAKGSTSYPKGTVEQGADIISYLVKLQYPTTPDLKVYGLLGGTTARLRMAVGNAKVKTPTGVTGAKTGFSYGVGGEYRVTDQLYLGAEWEQYWTNVNIGLGTKSKIWGAVGSLTYDF